MTKSLASLILVAACAHRAPVAQPQQAAPQPIMELQPINTSGARTRSVRAGDKLVDIGLAYRGKRAAVVRVDGLCATVRLEGPPAKCQRPDYGVVFEIPAAIPGVPATAFDYMIDPGPAADGEQAEGRFTVVASGSAGQTSYHTTWVLTWNPKTATFEASAPSTTSEDRSKCLACD
jgi:hypothetical protein